VIVTFLYVIVNIEIIMYICYIWMYENDLMNLFLMWDHKKITFDIKYNFKIFLFPTCDHKENVLKNYLLYVHNHVIFTYDWE